MIVGFLADKIPYPERRGWGVYSYELLRAMVTAEPDILFRCYYNFFRRGDIDQIVSLNVRNMENVIWRLPGRVMDLLWERIGILSAEQVLGNVDVLHVPYEFLPRARGARTVVTVHDVTFLRHPEFLDSAFVKLFTARIRRIVDVADVIIADSANTRNELISLASAEKDRVRVVPLAADLRFRPVVDPAVLSAVSARYCTGPDYVLFVGAADEDKNLLRLAQAFARVRASRPELRLVLAGKASWGFDRLMKRLGELNLAEGVILAGFVADADLPALYSGAKLLAIPSIHEGFGLPALEAMSCGTPVLCSNSSSLPEIVGDAGVQVDPFNVDDIEKGLRKLLDESAFAARCRDFGLRRAEQFSWKITAEKVIAIYKELAS